MTIVYWPDGCWVTFEELGSMAYRCEGIMLDVPENSDDATIDALVRDMLQ